ncbi:MAG: EAL domain-containing protein [Oscillospiraceae bacterium]|nr:EAL domain-containing protein [Oscillospiraceae bacterium]
MKKKKSDKSSTVYKTGLSVNSCVIFILIFLLVFASARLAASRQTIHLFGIDLSSGSVNGILCSILIMIPIMMTSLDRKRGFILSLIMLAANAVTVIGNIYFRRSLDAIPGLAYIFLGVFMVFLLKKNLTQIARNEDELFKLAYRDSLTGLPNRRAFDETVRDIINQGRQKQFALAVIDLDNFKGINDTIGHECGDGLLCEVARRWSAILSPSDFLARQGGDEFILILKDDTSKQLLMQRIDEFANALGEVMTVKEHSIFASASFGIACYPQHADDSEKLFRYADMAMYHSKKSKTNKVTMFDISMAEPIENEFKYDRLIRDCLLNDTFELVFQPQFYVGTHQFRGFEALLRMKDDSGMYINPNNFIPYAEQSRLILEIDRWVLRNAMQTIRPYFDIIDSKFILSINISALHLQSDQLMQDISSAIMESGFPANYLEIEITETSVLSSVSRATELLKRIKMLGVSVALDDFGTGYASLSNLSELPLNLVKIDKSFMDKMLSDVKYRSFISGIISMGHILGFEVIAEGVEYEVQLDILRSLHCDYVQGFLWGKPINKESMDKLIKNIYFPDRRFRRY